MGSYINARNDHELQALLVLIGSTEKILHSFKVDDEYAYGYDEAGKEVVKAPITEPKIVRDYHDGKLNAYRQNTP